VSRIEEILSSTYEPMRVRTQTAGSSRLTVINLTMTEVKAMEDLDRSEVVSRVEL
jgi:hypothetical protein